MILRLRSALDTVTPALRRRARAGRRASGGGAVPALSARAHDRGADPGHRRRGRRGELRRHRVPARCGPGPARRARAAPLQLRRAAAKTGRAGHGRTRRGRWPRDERADPADARRCCGACRCPTPGARDRQGRRVGGVLVIGGSPEVPGARRCWPASRRCGPGAGKLQIGDRRRASRRISASPFPKPRVFALPETADGGIGREASARHDARRAGAKRCSSARACWTRGGRRPDGRLLDAATAPPASSSTPAALQCGFATCEAPLRRHGGRIVLTPHAGEMASLLGIERRSGRRGPARRRAAGGGPVPGASWR